MLLERLGKLEEQKAPFFWLLSVVQETRSSGHLRRRDEAKSGKAQNFGPPELNWSFKGLQQNLWWHNWTRSLEINTAAYMRGFYQSNFILYLLYAVSKKIYIQALNFRTVWAIDFQPLFLRFYCLFPFFLFSSPHTSPQLLSASAFKEKKEKSAAGEDVKGFFWGTLIFEYNLNSSKGLCTGKTYF